MDFQQHLFLPATSDAPLQWLVSMLPYILGIILILLVSLFIVSKVWLFPSRERRLKRNRRKLHKGSR
ncbi:hypothetical protein [Cernens ardua]|uniref:hypothetical protein n=1 Tax=Cernens ardua TaxID=3402176 RepID=UPI003F955084